jgi:hypothetical protein
VLNDDVIAENGEVAQGMFTWTLDFNRPSAVNTVDQASKEKRLQRERKSIPHARHHM